MGGVKWGGVGCGGLGVWVWVGERVRVGVGVGWGGIGEGVRCGCGWGWEWGKGWGLGWIGIRGGDRGVGVGGGNDFVVRNFNLSSVRRWGSTTAKRQTGETEIQRTREGREEGKRKALAFPLGNKNDLRHAMSTHPCSFRSFALQMMPLFYRHKSTEKLAGV